MKLGILLVFGFCHLAVASAEIEYLKKRSTAQLEVGKSGLMKKILPAVTETIGRGNFLRGFMRRLLRRICLVYLNRRFPVRGAKKRRSERVMKILKGAALAGKAMENKKKDKNASVKVEKRHLNKHKDEGHKKHKKDKENQSAKKKKVISALKKAAKYATEGLRGLKQMLASYIKNLLKILPGDQASEMRNTRDAEIDTINQRSLDVAKAHE